MNIEVITKEDLQILKQQIIEDIKILLIKKEEGKKEWLRSKDVTKLLRISSGTLQNLRISGTLKPAKIGGIFLYRFDEIESLLENIKNNR